MEYPLQLACGNFFFFSRSFLNIFKASIFNLNSNEDKTITNAWNAHKQQGRAEVYAQTTYQHANQPLTLLFRVYKYGAGYSRDSKHITAERKFLSDSFPVNLHDYLCSLEATSRTNLNEIRSVTLCLPYPAPKIKHSHTVTTISCWRKLGLDR